MIRIVVTRTVDDVIVNKMIAEPDDKIVDQRKTLCRFLLPTLPCHAARDCSNSGN